MDRSLENWKKFPLAVIGETATGIPGAIPLPPDSSIHSSLNINGFYVLLALPGSELESAAAALLGAGLSPEQLILLSEQAPALLPASPFVGWIEPWAGESPEEFRARLLLRLEIQRQRKLDLALQAAENLGLRHALGAEGFGLLLDAARLAHSLACGLQLTPELHSRALQESLRSGTGDEGPWPADLPPERLIALAARLLAGAEAAPAGRAAAGRELLREKCARLPFRTRNELLHQLENSLGSLGGRQNAA